MSLGLDAPWALLLAPLPWVLRRWLPRAPAAPREALWLPHFDALPGLAPLDGPGLRPRLLPLLIWAATLLALAQPRGDGIALYRWPLVVALLLAALLAARLTRPPRRYRRLPGAHPGEAPRP